jgi:hypothetical protein
MMDYLLDQEKSSWPVAIESRQRWRQCCSLTTRSPLLDKKRLLALSLFLSSPLLAKSKVTSHALTARGSCDSRLIFIDEDLEENKFQFWEEVDVGIRGIMINEEWISMFIKFWYAIPGVHWYYIQRNRGQLLFLPPKRKLHGSGDLIIWCCCDLLIIWYCCDWS